MTSGLGFTELQSLGYDHEFVCLNSELDPSLVSTEEALALNRLKYKSAAEMIQAKAGDLPGILKSHINLIAASYDWKGYRDRNLDLRHLTPHRLVDHFIEYGLTEPRHWKLKATLLDRRFSSAVAFGSDAHLTTSFQVVVHCYHYHVLVSQLPYLRNLARLGGRIVLLVANESISSAALSDFLGSLDIGSSTHEWLRVPNHGEDWSSFHHAYSCGYFENDGVTFKLQTKLSSNLGRDGGMAWIDEALSPLCSNYKSIIETLSSHVFDGFRVCASRSVKQSGFGVNPSLIESIAAKFEIEYGDGLRSNYFAAGSMFSATNIALRDFYEALGDIDYSKAYDQGSQFCGRFAGHALERIFFYFTEFNSGLVRWC